MPLKTFTIWANNSGGSDNATVNITINDEAPDISYNPDWFVLTNNTAMSPTATPTNAGGAIPSGIIAEPLQVGSPYGEGRSNSIAVDSNGVAHVVYFGGYQYTTLYYATNANGSWVTTVIKQQQGSSSGASIVIDANDTIHISYSHTAGRFSTSNNLYYSTCSSSCSSASSWSGVLVESGSGLHNDIAIDTNGTLHISHLTSGSIGSSLQHSTCSSSCTSSSSWTTTSILTSATNVISSISMTTDSNNSIHILYREGYGYPTFDLNYATCSSGCTSASSWSTVEIDASTTSSYMSKQSIAVDSNNGIHITYGLNGNLTYATCSSSCTSASSWTNTTVDTGSFNGVGEIALDSNEHLYISFGNGSSSAASKLAYATCSSSCTSSSSWTNTTFNTTAGTVRGLALDSNDRVHISYHTSSTDKLLRYLAIEPSSIVYGYSISPALPAGLSLEISTGEISGTPTELSANTTYTITVRNSGGVNTTTITIEVVDQVPTVAYSPADLTLTNNTVSSDLPLVPTITGSGEITSWELNASLPSGLTFETSNGTIWGTPTELWTQTSYMVWANNSGGQSVAYLNITVVDELPTLSYSPENLTLTKGLESTDLPLNATLTGPGVITSWAISPALPSGLSFGTSNGTIWGIPTVLQTIAVTYTIHANNSGGSVNATVNITINDEAPDIEYSPDWFVLTNNTAMSPTATPTNAGGAIPSTVIDSTGYVGQYTSIAIDSNGYKHIAYGDGTNCHLMYATDKTGTWVNISVDTTGNACSHIAIAIDSNDAVHISYLDGINKDLRYATCSSDCTTASNWDDVSVDTSGSVGAFPSIAIDSNDAVHISYHDYSNHDLKYATCSSGCTTASNWDVVSVDTTGTVGQYNSIAIDSNDAVHISYHDVSNNDLKYATCSSGCTTAINWDDVSVDTTGNVGSYTSIAIDSNDVVHISYYVLSNNDLKYATCSSGCTTVSNWNVVIVDPGYGVGPYTSIAIDSNDALHISYRDYFLRDLKYATCSSGCTSASNWDDIYVDTTGDVGRYTSIAIDSNDAVHISYHDQTNYGLKYAVLDSSSNIYGYSISPALPAGLDINLNTGEISGTPTAISANTTYTITARNSGGVNTTTITIEVVDQVPTLSYSPENLTLTKGQSNTDLPLNATLTGSGTITSWAISPALPSGLSFGTSNGTIWGTPTSLMSLKTFTIWANNSGGWSLATVNITVNDEAPDISYNPDWFVLTNNTAMSPTATPTNAGGAIPSTVIDSTGDVGEYSSIVIDSYGFKHISYFDATNTKLKYATDKSGSWVHTTVNTNTQMGKYTSIAIDSEGYVHISYDYYSMSYNHLMYATDKSGSWVNTIADGSADVGSHTSIAVDSNDAVHISYYDATNTNLKYATCSSSCSSASSWSKVTIESSSGDVGKYNSIAIDSNNTLHISYRDSTNGDLRYATCSSSCTSASSWTRSTIDSDGNVGSRTSIAIDSNGAVHISYYDITNGDLKYATDQSGSWANTTVDSVGTVGKYSSIAIDANDVVHISYYDATNKDLKYASNMQSYIQTGVGNVIKFIDRDTKVGNEGTSIAVDSNGDVHISYYDDINGDLKYAALQGVHPWNVYGYSISPALPAGLSLNFNSGEISGTPTALSTNTTYTITARNTGGTNTTTITIVVLDEVPTIAYSPNDLDLTNNTASSDLPLAPTITGSGEIVTWAISPSEPSGLSFDTSTGVLSGTPTELLTRTMFTITATNTGGNATAYINITIVDEVPTIAYSPENLTLTKGLASTDLPLTPTLTGSGAITSWAISPALPSGLSFGTSNGTIWGIATVLQTSPVTYTVRANNSGGSDNATINITINDQAPNISYSPNELNLTKYLSSSDLPLSPTNTGGNTQTTALCSSSGTPHLFVVSDHEGTRHVLCGTTLYSIDLNGTQTVSTNHVTGTAFALEIDDDGYLHIGHWVDNYPYIEIYHATNKNGSWQSSEAFDFSYGGSVGYDSQGFSMAVGSDDSIHFTYIRVTSAGNSNNLYHLSNQSGSWSSALLTSSGKPSAPSLALNDDNVPHVAFTAGNSFSVGKYESGSYTTLLSRSNYMEPDIVIDAQGDVHVVYRRNGNGLYYSTNASGSWQHTTLDSTARHFDVRIALDSNEYPHVMTASVSGQNNNYRLVNYYSHDGSSWNGGSITSEINLQQPRPDLFVDDNDVISMVYHDGTYSNLFTGTGSTTYGYSISPALPSGLHFSQSTGTISGIATVQMNRTMFTITANNSGGSSTAYINITVNDRMPSFTYSPENLTLTNNTVSSDLPLVPTVPNTADAPTEWVLMGTLPAGLNFGSNNGTIWGTATEVWTTTNYTVYGNNTGGSFNASINITVNDEVPTIVYSPNDLNMTNNTASLDLPLSPTITGSGEIVTWAISPSVPSGLSFSTSTGTLSGTPTELLTRTMFTITGTNTGGTATAYINITIVDEVPTIAYSPNDLDLTNNTASTDLPLSPTITGSGEFVSWAISPSEPSGLSFDTSTGVLSGTPTELLTRVQCTPSLEPTLVVHATAYINITIVDEVPTIVYSPNDLNMTNNTASTDLPLSSDHHRFW
jgi:hypothetical protein